ncbi:unnamed protein product, partial [Amoebophrya sp. A120]
ANDGLSTRDVNQGWCCGYFSTSQPEKKDEKENATQEGVGAKKSSATEEEFFEGTPTPLGFMILRLYEQIFNLNPSKPQECERRRLILTMIEMWENHFFMVLD